MNYVLVELDNVQRLEVRVSRENYPEELINMRTTAMLQQEDSIWRTFHTWEQDERN